VRSDVNRAIWRLFKSRGITIPRAQLDVRMFDADGRIIGQGVLPARAAERRAEPPAVGGAHHPPPGP
jgi:small-conductance mechanosensitive channel